METPQKEKDEGEVTVDTVRLREKESCICRFSYARATSLVEMKEQNRYSRYWRLR